MIVRASLTSSSGGVSLLVQKWARSAPLRNCSSTILTNSPAPQMQLPQLRSSSSIFCGGEGGLIAAQFSQRDKRNEWHLTYSDWISIETFSLPNAESTKKIKFAESDEMSEVYRIGQTAVIWMRALSRFAADIRCPTEGCDIHVIWNVFEKLLEGRGVKGQGSGVTRNTTELGLPNRPYAIKFSESARSEVCLIWSWFFLNIHSVTLHLKRSLAH